MYNKSSKLFDKRPHRRRTWTIYNILYNGMLLPLKIAPFQGELHPHLIHHTHPSPLPKRHLDRFVRFCRVHDRDRQTDRPTDHATSVTMGCIYVRVRSTNNVCWRVTTDSVLFCYPIDDLNFWATSGLQMRNRIGATLVYFSQAAATA